MSSERTYPGGASGKRETASRGGKARRVFVAATGQHCGKTTTSLLLMQAARRKFGRVGFIKPVGQEYREIDGLRVDKDAALMAEVFDLEEQLVHMSPVVADRGFTRRYLDGEVAPRGDELQRRILDSVAALERQCDAIVIEGTGHSGVGAVFGLSNARVAGLLDAPVVLVTGGGIGNVVDRVHLALPLYRQEGAELRAVMANKLLPAKREQALRYLGKALRPCGLEVLAGLDYTPTLANPSLRNIALCLATELRGDPAAAGRLVGKVQMGVASSQRVVDLLERDTLLITASSRDELLVTLASLYEIPEYHQQIAGIVIAGALEVSPITRKILDSSRIPYLRTETTSTVAMTTLMEHVAKIGAEDRTKLDWLFECGRELISDSVLAGLFSEPGPGE